jgi:hypothetical protein
MGAILPAPAQNGRTAMTSSNVICARRVGHIAW